MTLVSWTPFREFDDLIGRYNRVLASAPAIRRDAGLEEWQPMANISETDKEYLIKAELPEVDKKAVEITVNDGVISIKGERKLETADESEKQHRVEFSYGSFTRSFSLPADVDEQAIYADSKDGVLKIHLPKSEIKQPKPIAISIN